MCGSMEILEAFLARALFVMTPLFEIISDKTDSLPFVFGGAVDEREFDEVATGIDGEDDVAAAAAAAIADACAILFSKRFCKSKVVEESEVAGVVELLLVFAFKTAPLTIRGTEWLSRVFDGDVVVGIVFGCVAVVQIVEDVVACVLIIRLAGP